MGKSNQGKYDRQPYKRDGNKTTVRCTVEEAALIKGFFAEHGDSYTALTKLAAIVPTMEPDREPVRKTPVMMRVPPIYKTAVDEFVKKHGGKGIRPGKSSGLAWRSILLKAIVATWHV